MITKNNAQSVEQEHFPKNMAAHLATLRIADPKVVRHLPSMLVDLTVGMYLVKK